MSLPSCAKAKLEKIQPDFIFIGNSMLDSRIDPDYFQESTGKKIYIIWHGGIMSSVWYLIMKNVIVVSEVKPKTVFIFFRDKVYYQISVHARECVF